ncbi:MAG: CoA transferase, partial [Planctomycetaceae bacterium]|nr:CoA transferase [Planctomycetaceae bacterium]
TGMFTALGIVASLRDRDRTNTGADLDLSMLECTVATLENAVVRYATTGKSPGPIGTRHPSIAPFQAYRASDGQIVIAAGNEILWRRVCEVLAAPELLADPKLATNRDRSTHVNYLEPLLNAKFATRTVAEWLAELDAAGVPAAPICNLEQVVADPQLQSRGIWHTLSDTDDTSLLTAGTPFMINGAKPTLSPQWPRLGEHNAEVRRTWLGAAS